jgi:hypothetical protein
MYTYVYVCCFSEHWYSDHLWMILCLSWLWCLSITYIDIKDILDSNLLLKKGHLPRQGAMQFDYSENMS